MKPTHGQAVGSTLVRLSCTAVAIAMQFGLATQVHALAIDTGNDDLKLRWDNTVKYNLGYRLKNPSDTLTADANLDDGDRNFRKGVVSNRFDLLSELDVGVKDFGARLSGAAWYDTVYNRSTDNNSPQTANSVSVPYNELPTATRNLHGRRGELLDAFVFGRVKLGDMPLTVRAGKHTLIYGESLFFGSNGIAAAQGPVDVVKLVTVPGSQFKEILRPVNQLSAVLQLTNKLSLGAYYQLSWRKSLIPGAGSFLSPADFVGDGAERFIVGGPIAPGAGPMAFWRGVDGKAKNSGQGGAQLRWTPEDSDWEFGFYAARYHDKTPYLYLDQFAPAGFNMTTGQIGTIHEVYHEGIRTYGASATTSIGQLNLAFEGSIRTNASLVSDPQPASLSTFNNSSNPAYAVGKTGHLQASAIYVLTQTPLWDAGSFLGEVAWNRRLSVQKNPGAIDPNTTRDAAALRLIFEPQYFQVVPGVNLGVPIGLGWNFYGRSSSIFNWNGGSSRGGDYSIGLNATYNTVWNAALSYTGFFGAEDGFLTPANSPTPMLSYKQVYKDRNFISLTLKRSF